MGRAEIIERLEKLTGPDRELDRAIMAIAYLWERRHIGAACWDDGHDTCCPGGKHIDDVWVDPTTDKWVTNARDGFNFTASLDAAVALVEKMLPGWGFYLRSDKEGHGCGLVYPDAFRVTPCHCRGATPPIAMLLALFRALQDEEAR